jgi:hypothetical protein
MKYKVASDKVIGKVLDGEAVVINLNTGMYYGLDGPAARVWDLLSNGIDSETIEAQLHATYPRQTSAAQELAQLLGQMSEAGLLIADPSGPEVAPDPGEWPAEYQLLEMTCYDDVAEMVALDPPLPELAHEMMDQPRDPAA